jgi:branched-chain amino acid transport system substrate-binding protein
MRTVFALGLALLMTAAAAFCDDPPIRTFRVGYIGSLTDFAAPYGSAVLDGVRLAQEELRAEGRAVELFVEDDRSSSRDLMTAYKKLHALDNIQALITGSWWADKIVESVKADAIPFLSCETLYSKDFVPAPNYFSLLGDFRDWIGVFRPLIAQKGWKQGAMVKFVSGASDTMRDEFASIFSSDGRRFVGAIEYSDFEMQEAATIASRLRTLSPDVVYVDGQPDNFPTIMKRLAEQKAGFSVLTHDIARAAWENKSFSAANYPGQIYYSTRDSYDAAFSKAFEERYRRKPASNADLGYYALLLTAKALSSGINPVDSLRSNTLEVHGRRFVFDEHNVYRGIRQEVFTLGGAGAVRVDY